MNSKYRAKMDAQDVKGGIDDGDVVAVRSLRCRGGDETAYVIGGEVGVTYGDGVWYAHIDVWSAWACTPGESDSIEMYDPAYDIDVGEPKAVRKGDKDDYSTDPVVAIHPDRDTATLIVPSPVYSSGLEYYTPQPHGEVVAFETGFAAEPGDLLPGEPTKVVDDDQGIDMAGEWVLGDE